MDEQQPGHFLYNHDLFSQWLGIKILAIAPGYCKLQMVIRNEMVNGFGIAHGAIAYALADSALAFASNTKESQSVSIETSISHIKILKPGTTIVATAMHKHSSNKIGIYEVDITTEAGEPAALFKGTVYKRNPPAG